MEARIQLIHALSLPARPTSACCDQPIGGGHDRLKRSGDDVGVDADAEQLSARIGDLDIAMAEAFEPRCSECSE
jgi:hypothetical protein